MGGASSDHGLGISVDAGGNVYTTGDFSGTTDFDPSVRVFNLSSDGSSNIFVSKLDVSGNFAWAKKMGGVRLETFQSGRNGVNIDGDGNVYTVGFFSGTVDFDPNNGVYNLMAETWLDIFVQKLTPTVLTSVEESAVSKFWSIYPNPASDKINVDLSEKVDGTVSILDIDGKVVASKVIDDIKITLSTSELTNGLYILKIASDKRLKHIKSVL